MEWIVPSADARALAGAGAKLHARAFAFPGGVVVGCLIRVAEPGRPWFGCARAFSPADAESRKMLEAWRDRNECVCRVEDPSGDGRADLRTATEWSGLAEALRDADCAAAGGASDPDGAVAGFDRELSRAREEAGGDLDRAWDRLAAARGSSPKPAPAAAASKTPWVGWIAGAAVLLVSWAVVAEHVHRVVVWAAGGHQCFRTFCWRTDTEAKAVREHSDEAYYFCPSHEPALGRTGSIVLTLTGILKVGAWLLALASVVSAVDQVKRRGRPGTAR